MSRVKTKSIKNIEQRMLNLNADTLRYQILQHSKRFKTSWIDLGGALYTVWKDKIFKEWGYSTFEAYATKEIGIRIHTALKLLRSYYYLEKENPHVLEKEYCEEIPAAHVPTYESIDILRLAHNNKGIDKEDFEIIKNDILEKGKDAREVKRDLTQLVKQYQQLQPQQARQKKREAQLRRLLSLLKSLRQEIKISHTLPARMIKDIDKLIEKVEISMA